MRFLMLTLLGCAALAGSATPGSCGLVLNEIMAGPSRDWNGDGVYNYRDDEWVEVFNPGPGPLTLDGYLIGDTDQNPLYGLSGSLNAGGHRVVFGSDAVAYQQAHGLTIRGLRLANDGGTVTLLQAAAGDTILVDSHTYVSHEAGADRSTGLRPDGSGTWEVFDSLDPYTGNTPPLGNGLMPTPGGANGEPPVPVRGTSWGRIRSLYR